jgi:hypothetical protein
MVAWDGEPLEVGSTPIGVIPSEGRPAAADGPVRSFPLPPATDRRTPALDEHRPSEVRSQSTMPQFLS